MDYQRNSRPWRWPADPAEYGKPDPSVDPARSNPRYEVAAWIQSEPNRIKASRLYRAFERMQARHERFERESRERMIRL